MTEPMKTDEWNASPKKKKPLVDKLNDLSKKIHKAETEPIENMKNDYISRLLDAFDEVDEEIKHAKKIYEDDFNSQHEAIAVIREEYLELERECFMKEKNYNLRNQRKEAKQLAAMAIRFMIELT